MFSPFWKKTEEWGISNIAVGKWSNCFLTKVFGICFYKLSLDILYLWIISPNYSYSYSDFFTWVLLFPYLCSVLAVLVFAPFLARLGEERNPSSIIVCLFSYMYFIPLCSYYGCKGTVKPSFFLIALCYWALLFVWQFRIPALRLKPKKRFRNDEVPFLILTIFSCTFTMFISWKYTGFRLSLDLLGVYSLRSEAVNYQMSAMTSYFIHWMPAILSVFLMYWLNRKKFIMSALIAVVFLFLFSIAGNKSIFFLLILVVGIFLCYRKWMFPAISWLFVGLNIVELVEYLVNRSSWILTFITRRMMFVPVTHSEAFFRAFQIYPVDYFRDGIMGKFSFDSIYMQTIPRFVADWIGEYEMNANNGLLGDMFANLPVSMGLVLMPIIIVLCLRIIDMTTRELPDKVILPVAVYFAVSFINSSWSTVLLTHGFLVVCLLLYFYPREKRS